MNFPNRRFVVQPRQFFTEHHHSEAHEVLSTVLDFVVIVLIILAALWVIRALLTARASGPRLPQGVSTALNELDLRYARGEIDHADYAQRRFNLLAVSGGPPAPPSSSPPTPGQAPPTTTRRGSAAPPAPPAEPPPGT